MKQEEVKWLVLQGSTGELPVLSADGSQEPGVVLQLKLAELPSMRGATASFQLRAPQAFAVGELLVAAAQRALGMASSPPNSSPH